MHLWRRWMMRGAPGVTHVWFDASNASCSLGGGLGVHTQVQSRRASTCMREPSTSLTRTDVGALVLVVVGVAVHGLAAAGPVEQLGLSLVFSEFVLPSLQTQRQWRSLLA